jgi:hypothetical protein
MRVAINPRACACLYHEIKRTLEIGLMMMMMMIIIKGGLAVPPLYCMEQALNGNVIWYSIGCFNVYFGLHEDGGPRDQ